jgi:hypothetical protein
MCRILAVLRSISGGDSQTRVRLSGEFKKDLAWWQRFLPRYNGVSYIYHAPSSNPDAVFSTDACLSGCGGLCGNEYFHSAFPQSLLARKLDINSLELLAVVISCKLWGQTWGKLKILLYCDNQATVAVINSEKTHSSFMAQCLREMWLIAAVHDFDLRAIHLDGKCNRAADLLSRWHLDTNNEQAFLTLVNGQGSEERSVLAQYFSFNSDI